jgi:hypothetical protein
VAALPIDDVLQPPGQGIHEVHQVLQHPELIEPIVEAVSKRDFLEWFAVISLKAL